MFFFVGTIPGNFHIIVHNYHIKKAYNVLRDFIVKELEAQKDEGVNVTLIRAITESE